MQDNNYMNPIVTWYSLFLTHSFFYFPFLEKEMAAHSSILAWKIPWTEELGRLQSIPFQFKVKVKVLVARLSELLGLHGLWPTRLLRPWDSPGKNIGVGSHSLLQGIFPTQGLNLGLVHCRCGLCRLSHQGSIQPNCSTQNINSSVWVFFFFFKLRLNIKMHSMTQIIKWQKNWTYPKFEYKVPLIVKFPRGN